MATKPDYAAVVAQAESAVAAVKDPELRRAAFEKILDDLLQGRPHTSAPAKKGKRPPRAAAKSRTKAKGGPQAHISELAGEGFFKKPKTIAQVKAELANRGHHIPLTSLSGPLQTLCQRKILRRQKTKNEGKGTKQTFNYSDW